jgi:nucleoside-diphosphate-sugar epimerase
MSILVTGGAGFIGSHAAEYYAKKGEEVIVRARNEDGLKDILQLLSIQGIASKITGPHYED